MRKNEATQRQINAAREELKRKKSKKLSEWEKTNPRPKWQDEEEWIKTHKSPRTIFEAKRAKAEAAFAIVAEAILFDAKMGKITAEELYSRTNSF